METWMVIANYLENISGIRNMDINKISIIAKV